MSEQSTLEADPAPAENLDPLVRLSRIGAAIASERDPDRVIQRITDEATSLVGAQFGAFFYNVVNPSGESYMLYSIAGVPREAFSRFPMPRNTEVFAPTFAGKGIVRSGDITRDPRYGKNSPHRGMPEGHLPVRSYLAAPVLSFDGKVLGGLFFGHAELSGPWCDGRRGSSPITPPSSIPTPLSDWKTSGAPVLAAPPSSPRCLPEPKRIEPRGGPQAT